MEKTSRRNFLKSSGALVVSSLDNRVESADASPPNVSYFPTMHRGFTITPWGTFSNMRWGNFNVVTPVFPNPSFRNRVPARIQSQNRFGAVETVDPRSLPQGIIATKWGGDKNQDGYSSLDEYVGLNQGCYDSDKPFIFAISKPRGFYEGQSFDMRVFGPNDELVARERGTFKSGINAVGSLNLSALADNPEHGTGNYIVEYLINGQIRERREFTLVNNNTTKIPSGREPWEYGIDINGDNLGHFTAESYRGGNGSTTLEEFSGINRPCYSQNKPFFYGLFNGMGFKGTAKLTLMSGDESASAEKDITPGWVTVWRQPEDSLPPGDYRSTVTVDGYSQTLSKSFKGSFIPRDFTIV